MKTCRRCLLNSNYRNIVFDRSDTCNYCRTYDHLKAKLTDVEGNKKWFEERLDLLRGKYEYDCLVGISGGKDSSYVAFQLKNKYGLKILTFTFDNGFLTEGTKKNIEFLVEKLKVNHFFYKPDWTFYRECYHQALRHAGYPCPVCAYSSYAFMNKVAFEKKIPLCVHGRSPAQMFKELLNESLDPFLPFVWNNLSPYDIGTNKKTAQEVMRKSEYLMKRFMPDQRLREMFCQTFFPNREQWERSDFFPEFLGFFFYEKYDETSIKALLIRELGWSPPLDFKVLGHNDCTIHDAAMFLYDQVFGYSLLSLELSVMIRQGSIRREEALKRLELEECLQAPPNESLQVLFDTFHVTKNEIQQIIARARRRHALMRLTLKLRRKIGERGNGASDTGKGTI